MLLFDWVAIIVIFITAYALAIVFGSGMGALHQSTSMSESFRTDEFTKLKTKWEINHE